MKLFNRRIDKLSVQDGCLLWGSHVVVPRKGHKQVLDLEDKSLARTLV